MKTLSCTLNGVTGRLFLEPYLWIGYIEVIVAWLGRETQSSGPCGGCCATQAPEEAGRALLVTHPNRRDCAAFTNS